MSIFDARYDRLSEIKKKRAANSPVQSGEVKAAGAVKASPFDGYAVTSRPGKRNAPTAGASTNHAGLDRAMPRGTALKLPIDVTYYRSGSDKARGKWIEFKDAGGNILHYQHLDSYGIFKPGETVPAGSQIAVSGASGIGTGAHLHEEYWSPDGQNITESYWGGLSKGTASGALPTEYKKAGGNVFNVGTNALAREGRSALAGSYEGLSRFEKVQMLKKRRDERRGLRERVADKMSRADEAYTFGRKKDDYSVGGIINKWQENENNKALAYEKKNADAVNRAQQRLGDDNFKKAAFDGLERAKRTVGRVYIKPSGRDDTTVLTSYMTDEELLTYSGLLQTEGQKSAAEYIDAIKDTLKARAFEHAQYPTKFAGTAKQLYNNPYDLPLGGQGAAFKKQLPLQKSGVTLEDLENESGKSYAKALAMGTAASFATAAALGKTGEQMIKNAVTGKYEPTDTYDPAFMPARLQRSAQEGTTRNDSQWMKFLKSAGFSIAGSLVNAAAGGPIGAGASLAMMGASAAGQSAFEGAERGLTPAQATTLGAVNGALEAATEMIPVKNIFKAFKSKSAARELAKEILQAGFENAEQEAINTLAGNIADEIITGDRSELMTSAREYAAKLQQEKGISNEQAISEGLKKATIDKYITEPLYSAASGALSGAVQTGASAASGRAAADISDTVRAYSAGQNAAAAIDKLGYKIKYTDDPGLDGKVDKGAKTVYFNREGDNIRQTVKHEISHMLENNEKYGEFRSFVKEEMPQAYKAAERRVSDRLERVNAYREERGLSKYKSDAETIEAETFAELAEVLKSDRLIRRFALGSDMPKTMRVIEFARDASARLSEKLGTDGGWGTAARKWAAALSEAQADESGVRNKIAYTENNTPVVVVEEDILKGVPKEDWAKKAREALRNFAGGIDVGGRIINVTKNTRREYTSSKYSKVLGKNDEGKYADKMRAANNADEIVNGSRDYINEAPKHTRKDGIRQFARGNVLMEIGGRKYSAEVVIGTNGENRQVLYDVVSVKNAEFTKKSAARVDGQSEHQTPIRTFAADTDSVAQKGDTVNSNIRESNTNDTNVRNKIRDAEITSEDIKAVQSVGRKSVNDFSSEDIKATEGFAKKYYREMGTKSPFFRAWFGDWRAEDKSPVRIADRKGAARGVVRNADTGWDVQVSGKVFNETKSHNQNYNVKARPYLDYINSIVENAVLLDSSTIPIGKAKSENSAMMHSLYAIADMGSGRELVKLYVEELNDVNSDGTIKRAYQLQNIENQQSNDRVQEKSLAPSASTADVNNISQLYALVKASDKNFSSKSASKVVNEDGSPKVVYHGTGEFGFTVFDPEYSDDKSTIFFTDNADVASTYSGKNEIRQLSDESKDFSTMSWEEIVEALNNSGTADDEYMKSKYMYVSVERLAKIKASVDKDAQVLDEYLAGYNFDRAEEKVKRQAARLQGYLDNLEYERISTPLYWLLHYSDVFRNSGLEKRFARLESTQRLLNEFKKTGKKEAIVDGELGGYTFRLYDLEEARAKAEQNSKKGIYAVYLDIKKPFIAEGNGNNWNDITYYEVIPEELKRYYKNGLWRHGTTREVAKYAKEQGFDGVIIKNITDNGGNNFNVSNTPTNIYIAFNSEQIKSATDNVGTFDKGNPDIRFKIRDVEDIPTGAAKKKGYDREHFNSYADYLSNRIDRAEKKNRQLEQIRKTLEHMANVAGEVHVDVMKISDYAAELKRQTASKMPRREIAARLEDIYTGLAKSDPTDDGTRAYNALFELADDMLSASDRVDRSMYEQYAPLREFLRSTPISLAKSDRADIADWSDFVNRNRGRIRISEKGTGVDAIYEQLAAEYPEFFAESGYTHPADRLKHIARVRDSLDPVYNNQRHTDDEAAILAQSMFANYFSDENASIEHQTLLDLIRGKLERDIADKYEEKYRKEIEHHKERVEYYKNIDKKVAERAAAAEGGEKAPEYVDTDVTDEYLHKYVKDIKFGEDAGGVRILRRKYADRESVVIDFDRPTVYRDAKPGEYTMSDDPVYKDIMERVKRRQKIEENWHEGETREGTLPYDAQNIWRNMRKFFGERDYAEMKKLVLDPLDDSKRQYEYIQKFYSNIIYEKVVKELGIKMGSRLSALTQMYGEGVLTEEDLGTISEADMEKIKKADEIFRTVYDGLLDTINDSRKAIYPNAQDKVKKIEEEIAELRQEMFLIEAGYTSGDFSELDPKKWENLKQIDIRRESAEELIYRAQAAAKERVASLDGKIEQVEAELFKIGNRADLEKYQKLIDRRDRLVVRRSEIMNLTEAKVDKLKTMAQKLTNQFDENSSVYKEKLAKRLAALNRREGELIGGLATDEITYGRLIQRRRDYYHHFEELADMVPEFLGYMKVHADDKVSVANKIKGYINSRGLRHNKNIDNRLAGKSADTKPKAKWQSFAQRRTQTETVNYDAVGGFKRYVAAAAYSAAIDPNISIFRALADDLAMPIDGKPSDKSMGGFIDYLRKYANELAGKSNEYGDRFIARIVGRNWWNRLNRLSSRIKSNQVVYNVSCSTAQILNVPQAIAYMRNNPVALNGAIVDTVWGALPGKNEIKERYKYSSFLTERFSDNYTRFEPLLKRGRDNIANFMLGALDEAGTKYIWNAAYRSAIAEGSKTPIRYADDVTRRMVAGRGIGELPYYQKSKLVGMLIPFTLESGNVWDAVGDMMRDSAQKHGVDTKQGLARKAAKVGAGVDFGADLLVLFVMNHLFNYILAKIRGTDGGLFDPIADIKEGVRNNKGVLKTAGLIAGDFVGSFPVGGFAAGVYPEYGIELPGGINLPSRRAIFGGSDPTRFGTNGGMFLSAAKDPVHMLIPKAGGAQARKIGKAIYAFYNGAVRTRSGKVKYELSDKSLYNIIRGLTFGTSALTETEDYYNQKEVNFHDVPDGFEYKHKSREVTIGYDKVELRGDDLEQYETLRLARYKRLAQNDNVAFTLRNPYGTPEKGWSAEKKEQYEADRDRMKTVLVGLYEQGSITKDRLREIYSAYKNGGDIRVRGVEYYAPTKVRRKKKYSELTEYQRSDFKKKLDRDVKSGKLAVEDKEEYARMIRNKEWDFIATVDEYLTGDIKDLSKEEKKKVYSQINSLSTEFATRIWRERRDSWFDKWKVRRSGQLYKPAGVEKN